MAKNTHEAIVTEETYAQAHIREAFIFMFHFCFQKQPDPALYRSCQCCLTRELLTELIREIRVSGENDLEIVWNFRE